MRPRVLRLAHLLERHRQIEMRVGVERIQPQRFAVARLRFRETAEVVIDVAEVEMRLEEIGLEADRPLVERLRLGQLVAAVVDVGEVDQRRDQIRIELERLPVGRRRLVAASTSSPSSSAEPARKYSSAQRGVARGPCRRRRRARPAAPAAGAAASGSCAGAASSRKSNVSCPCARRHQRSHDAAERHALAQARRSPA